MIHTEYNWLLTGKRIFAQSWVPERTPKASINLIHGLGEHSGRYSRWGSLFAEKGYALTAMDLFGNGQTEGKQGHIKSYQSLLDQVDLMLQESEKNFPGAPRILYGHSMGGNIAINYGISKDPPVSGLIATSPWLRLVIPVSTIEKVFSKVANSLAPGMRIKAKGLGAEKLSRDPEHWADVRSDPLVHRKISARYVYEIMNMGEYALGNVPKINKPFLLMHGNADEITSHKASEELGSIIPDKIRLKIWDGLRHEMHNEPEYKEVFNYVVDWIEGLKLK
jgi:alpha-beta hydrolase superfamily lysophospholipase